MELQGRGCPKGARKFTTVRARNLRAAPIYGTETRRDVGASKTSLCLSDGGARVVSDPPPMAPMAVLEGGVAFLAKSVFFGSGKGPHYGFGKGFRAKCIGGDEKDFLRRMEILERMGGEVIWTSISHLGDLVISVSDLFI